jgi:hypothetical protein
MRLCGRWRFCMASGMANVLSACGRCRPMNMAKRLARHSDVRLTEDIYTDFELMAGPEREAAEMLVPERRWQRFVPEVR